MPDRVIMVQESAWWEMREALWDLLHHEITHIGPYVGQKIAAARAALAKSEVAVEHGSGWGVGDPGGNMSHNLTNEELISLGRIHKSPLVQELTTRLADSIDLVTRLEESLEQERAGDNECLMCEDLNKQIEELQETIKKLQRMYKETHKLDELI